jgi:hypothetical protein
MENPTISGGGTQGDNIFSGIKEKCMDPGQNRSKEELDVDEVLRYWGGSPMGHERLSI